jgi:hypothetical protein
MKTHLKFLVLALAGGLASSAEAQYYGVYNLFATVPDNDGNGYQNTLTVSSPAGSIADVNFTLNLNGGFNGDLYAFVAHNHTMAVLLNRVGRGSTSGVGYPDAGLGPDGLGNTFRFDDQAGHDVHLYRTFSYSLNGSRQLTGSWQPDGRALDPESAAGLFDTAPRLSLLSAFNGMDPNGDWTLFLADVSPGGESTLVSWGLEVTLVPEPGIGALTASGLAALVLWTRKPRGLHRELSGGA